MIPRCVSQRRITCATVRPCASAIGTSTSLWKMSCLPSANGPHDSIWMPCSCEEHLRVHLLMERVRLDLIDRRGDVVVDKEVHHPVRLEIAQSDSTGPALSINPLHRPPGAIYVTVGLVDQVQVHVIRDRAVAVSAPALAP